MTDSQTPKDSRLPKQTINWPSILWREWRFCHDREYAEHLFGLLVNQPLQQTAGVILLLLTAFAGGLIGWLNLLLLTPADWPWGMLIGSVTGAALGTVLLRRLHSTGRLVWGIGLQVLIAHPPASSDEYSRNIWKDWGWVWLVSWMSALGVGWTGVVLFDQPSPRLLMIIVIGLFLLFFFFSLGSWSWRESLVISAGVVGLIFGLTFGLGFAQLVSLTIGTLNVAVSGRLTGLGVGLGVGLLLGRRMGLLGTLIFVVSVVCFAFIDGTNTLLVAWLIGLLSGGLLGSLSYLLPFFIGELTFAQAYPYRFVYFWWLRRPFASQVEAALTAQGRQTKLLQRLADERCHPEPPEYYLANLRDVDWQIRFLARHMLVSLGGPVLPVLEQAAKDINIFSQVGTWIVYSIGWDTRQRLGHRLDQMICTRCLTICKMHMARLTIPSVIYCGCRTCGEDKALFYCPAGVVAVLDHTWKKQHRHQDGLLEVNWVMQGDLFDFNRVRIVQATDEEVERFAVQIGNDTDPIRRGRYPRMICILDPECVFSENTLRILQRTFGRVEFVSPDERSQVTSLDSMVKVD